MPSYCCAYNCKSLFQKDKKISFHKFPKNQELCDKWVQAVRRDKWAPTKNTVLCSHHFEEKWVDRTGQITRLREGAIPTKFDFPSHLVKVVKPRKEPKARSAEMEDDRTSSDTCSVPALPPDHSYSVNSSPNTMKRHIDRLGEVIEEKNKKIKLLNQRFVRLQRKFENMQDVMDGLAEKRLLTDSTVEMLRESFSGIQFELLKRCYIKSQNTAAKQAYPTELRAFASTLHFYSEKAYEYVREVFNMSLPHPSTLRRWFSSIESSPGFTALSFKILENKAKEATRKGHKLLCSLIIDEMSIKQGVFWNGKRFVGFVDFGTELESDTLPEAKDSFVFMVVPVNDHWKLPCAYFFINGLSGSERANLVNQCLMRLNDVGIDVVSITFDGTAVNFTMANLLGASLHPSNLNSSFKHPSTDQPIQVILDPCHMIKLMRNALGDRKVLKDQDGKEIKWKYISDLHDLQTDEGLKAANKLSRHHIEWRKQKMKVNLAVQTLSSSVADALEFCCNILHLQQFQGCEATVKFIRLIDRLFDFLNSRNPFARNFKAPLKQTNEILWKKFTTEIESYLRGLEDPATGKKMLEGNRRTPVMGFLTSLQSVLALYEKFVKTPQAPLKYLLTYKFSQDHIELFFNSIRKKGGWNNNPTVAQFESSYKRLLVHNHIKASNGNCEEYGSSLPFMSCVSSVSHDMEDIVNINRTRRNEGLCEPLQDEHSCEDDHDYCLPPHEILSTYCENVVEYIAGFVVRSLQKTLKCIDCSEALKKQTESCPFILQKNRGGLIYPSDDVIYICKTAEKILRSSLDSGKPSSSPKFLPLIVTKIMADLLDRNLFAGLQNHILDTPVECNHMTSLMSAICKEYLKVRLYHVGKSYTQKISGENIRKLLTKTILFKNQ